MAAYAGSGQIGDWPAAESLSYAFVLAEAQRFNNRKALKELRAIGPPPYSAQSLWTERTWLQSVEGHLSVRSVWNLGRIFLDGPESSVFDLPNILRGFRFSLDVMWTEVSRLNLMKIVPILRNLCSSSSGALITGFPRRRVWHISANSRAVEETRMV